MTRLNTIQLDDYELVNLIAALKSAMVAERTPLYVLNSGDWIGQVIYKLETARPEHPTWAPNRTPEGYAEAASTFI